MSGLFFEADVQSPLSAIAIPSQSDLETNYNDSVDNEEIIVIGRRMSDEQIRSWDIAVANASAEVWLLRAVGVGALAYLGAGSTLGAVVAAEAGYVVGTTLDSEDVARLTDSLAEAYYDQDGADGTWDGRSDYDRYAPYPFNQ